MEHYGNYGEGAASTTASLFSIAGGWGNVGYSYSYIDLSNSDL